MMLYSPTRLLICALALFALAAPAAAETGRYTMTPTPDGVLKLDTKTGSVSLCRSGQQGWRCVPVEEKRSRMQRRIEELEEENRRLRKRLARTPMPPAATPPGIPREPGRQYGQEQGPGMDMPTEEDVDKAMDFMEKLLGRFKGMIERLQKPEPPEDEGVPL